jgi:hypothetical protein
MTELIRLTGEEIDLSRPTAELASWLDQIKQFQILGRSAESDIKLELQRRADHDNATELDGGDYVINVDKPAVVHEWQDEETIEALKAVLADLILEGTISKKAADEALSVEVSYKVHSTKLKDLGRRDPAIAARIEDCVKTKEKPRRVSVKLRRPS